MDGLDYPHPTSAAASAVMRGNRKRDTRPELALRSELHARGLRYRVDHRIGIGQRRADVVFTRARVAVFVDGCYWHRCPEHGTQPRANASYWTRKLDRNVERDRDTDQRLSAAGWEIVRIWEHEPAASAAKRVEAVVRSNGVRQPTG